MDKETILNYVTETPGNTNRAVLSGMLDSIAESGCGVLIVHFSQIEPSGAWSADKTFEEVHEGLTNGMPVIAHIETKRETTSLGVLSDYITAPMIMDNHVQYLEACFTMGTSNGVGYYNLSYYPDGSITYDAGFAQLS